MKPILNFWLLNLLIIVAVIIAQQFHLFGSEFGGCLAVVVGEALSFGVAADNADLTAQRTSVSGKIDVTEARDKDGIVIAAALYNKTQDITIDGLGFTAATLGASLAITASPGGIIGSTAYVIETSVDEENTAFTKSSVKAKSWEGI